MSVNQTNCFALPSLYAASRDRVTWRRHMHSASGNYTRETAQFKHGETSFHYLSINIVDRNKCIRNTIPRFLFFTANSLRFLIFNSDTKSFTLHVPTFRFRISLHRNETALRLWVQKDEFIYGQLYNENGKEECKRRKKKKKEKILKEESHEIFPCSHQASLWLFFNISTQEGKDNKKKKKVSHDAIEIFNLEGKNLHTNLLLY